MRIERAVLGAIVGSVLATVAARSAGALTPLDVAYAGSMGAAMDGGVKAAAARALGVEVRGRGQGAMALARLIAAGSLRPDVFISVTSGPMRLVQAARVAGRAVAIARTRMVIAYSPRSRFAALLERADRPGAEPWWRILRSPGFRFGRTDPRHDPLGLNTLFLMDLAARDYHQHDLKSRILGSDLDFAQIFPEAGVMARLQGGELDAATAYRTQPLALGLPFVPLPAAIDLGEASLRARYAAVSETIAGRTSRPSPLVFYAAPLAGAAHPRAARAFVRWLAGPEGQRILRAYHYDAPQGAPALVAGGGPGRRGPRAGLRGS